MSNISIIKNADFFEIDFGDFKNQNGIMSQKIRYRRDSIQMVRCHSNANECEISMYKSTYRFSWDENGFANEVDTIEGNEPISNDDLYLKLKDLMVK